MSANLIKISLTPGATVLVADDSKAFCTRLSRLVALIPGVGTVVEACDRQAVLTVLASARPAMALVDTQVGDPSAHDLFRQIRAARPRITLLALTRFPSPSLVAAFREAGVDACFDKTTELDAIAPFIAARLPEAGGTRAPEGGHGLGNNQTPGKGEERA